MEDFIDRVSDFPNRRRLEIVSQTPNEIIADIYREEGTVSKSGTPITAKILNDMKNEFANQGTTIKINDQAQISVVFASDPQSQINNKANLDASNLTTDNIENWQNKLNDLPNLIDIQNTQSVPVNVYLSGQATVKETYLSSDGLTWYRVWSDGWKECGGTLQGTGGAFTMHFPITFSNTKYGLKVTPHKTFNASGQVPEYNRFGYNRTTTSFTFDEVTNGFIDWEAKGY